MSIFGKRIVTAMAMAAVLAVSALPITASAQVQERPPEIPEGELIKQPEIPGSWQGDGAQKPQGSDFTWVYDVTNIFDVPEGATVLDKKEQVKGPWKVFLVGEPSDYFCFYNNCNININDGVGDNVYLVADWYRQTLVNRQTGEATILDSSGLQSEVYDGTMTAGAIFAEDLDNNDVDRFMFASGDTIKDFLIVNMYQIGDRQYGLGVFSADNAKSLGNLYMTRQVATSVGTTATTTTETTATTSGSSDTGEGNKAISVSFRDLNWFSGYWTYEDSYSSDSFYLEPINDHQVYAVIGDEAAATHYGIVLDVVSDPSRSTISLYYPDGNRFDSINGTNINGTDAITMSDYNGVLFRTDKSVRAQEYWDHINDLFKGANEWYD